jgi:rhamnulokinase
VTRHLAIDVGAESGRIMLGSLDRGALQLREVKRFANEPMHADGSLRWRMGGIYDGIESGLHSLVGEQLTSVGVDTWGCDYGLVDERGALVEPPYHYRDHRTDEDRSENRYQGQSYTNKGQETKPGLLFDWFWSVARFYRHNTH